MMKNCMIPTSNLEMRANLYMHKQTINTPHIMDIIFVISRTWTSVIGVK